MRKVLAITITAAVLFAVGAFAASFSLNAEDVASGSDEVESCADEVEVDFNTTFVNTANDWDIDSADVDFFKSGSAATTCSGSDVTLVLENASNTVLATYTAADIASDSTATLLPVGGTEARVSQVAQASLLIDDVEISDALGGTGVLDD